jgi:ABC-type dipeptide/oligopeptide/nickel transport system ATPase component
MEICWEDMGKCINELVNIDRNPRVYFLIGVDGSGKTTITKWLVDMCKKKNISHQIIWSRFNNYLSIPLIALTKISKHCYYKDIMGYKFGFHDYENLFFIKYIFFFLQMIDVNIATFFQIKRKITRKTITICERGPYDTLIDVIADTGLFSILHSKISYLYYFQVYKRKNVIFLKRNYHEIITSRPELAYDSKLKSRMELYENLAKKNHWHIVDNNGSIEKTKSEIIKIIFNI